MWTQLLLGWEIWFLKHNLLLTASEQKRDNQEVNLGLQLQAAGNVSSFHHNCLTLFPPMTNLHFFTGIETSLINAWWQELTLICLRGQTMFTYWPRICLVCFSLSSFCIQFRKVFVSHNPINWSLCLPDDMLLLKKKMLFATRRMQLCNCARNYCWCWQRLLSPVVAVLDGFLHTSTALIGVKKTFERP